MAYLLEVPMEGGGSLVVQAGEADLPDDLELSALRPGEVVAQARQTLEDAIDRLQPAVAAIRRRLEAMGPDEITVEFGILLGAETGVVVAKGPAEVHFTLSLTWKPGERPRPLPHA